MRKEPRTLNLELLNLELLNCNAQSARGQATQTKRRVQLRARYDLEDRLLDFAAAVIDVSEKLPNSRAGNHIAGQLLRAGISPYGNHGEAQSSESADDFIHKMKICLKELRETLRWARLSTGNTAGHRAQLAFVLRESDELVRIFKASIQTAERNSARPTSRSPSFLATATPAHPALMTSSGSVQVSKFEVQGSMVRCSSRHSANGPPSSGSRTPLFALPFALAAMAVAARDNRGWPGWRTFGLILAAMVCARTCAMAFNRIADRKFDALNPRTAGRHLPTGQISLPSAVTLCLVRRRAGRGQLSAEPALFLPVARRPGGHLLLLADETVHGLYPRLSRTGAGPGARGRLAGGEGNRVSGREIVQMLVLAAVVVLWLVGFDIIYALAGLRIRPHSRAALAGGRLGAEERPAGRFPGAHVHVRPAAAFGLLCRFRIAYLVGWFLIVGCLVLEHWIARRRSLNWINVAFFRLNAVVSAVS